MTDLDLGKVQAFITNNCFLKPITSRNYIMLILWTEKKSSAESNFEINTIDSSVCFLWKPIDYLDNIPKCSYMFCQLCLCSTKWICLYVYIIKSFKYDYWFRFNKSLVRSVFGESVGKWSVIWRSVDLIKSTKNMFGVVISSVHFDRGLFCCSNFNFFYIDDKEETSLIARSSHANL